MPLPKSVTKVDRAGGVTFESNVDRANYLLRELVRRAQFDSAKLIRKRILLEQKKLPGMKKHRRLTLSTQYWVRKYEGDLQIGFKHDTWYGARSELGTHGSPPRNILRNTVMSSVDDIRRIQGQYLSAIESENKAIGLVNEDEYTSPDGEES